MYAHVGSMNFEY